MVTDLRIPVIFAAPDQLATLTRADDAMLVEAGLTVPPARVSATFTLGAAAHWRGCGCCSGRSAPAQALVGLYLARARGEGIFFRRVIAVVHDRPLVRGLLEDDVMVRARFMMVAPGSSDCY